jgi:hypothetical protein
MRIITKEVPKDFNIFQFSCTHYGSRLCHENGIDRMIHMINSEYDGIPAKNNYAVHHGDAIEGITPDDKRFFAPATKLPMIKSQVKYAGRKMSAIPPEQWIAWMQGNHEDKHLSYGYLGSDMADIVGAKFGTTDCKIIYKGFNNFSPVSPTSNLTYFRQYACHGRKQISSTADDPERAAVNMKLILKRHLKFKFGDCVLMTKGHTHKLITLKPRPVLYLHDSHEEIRHSYTHQDDISGAQYIHPDNRWYANVGAFYKVYGNEMTYWNEEEPENSVFSSYVARGEYDPVALGFVVTKVRDGRIVRLEKVFV